MANKSTAGQLCSVPLKGNTMPITEILSKNAKLYPDDISLVEINPKLENNKNMTWREFSLTQETALESYRKEITWKEFDQKANRFANLLLISSHLF